MTACREFREWMSASLDQALAPSEQARLDSHLAECPECRAAWKEVQWVHSQLKDLEKVEPPPWLASKIMAKIRAEAAPQPSFWQRFIHPIVMKPQLQVASILLLAATGYYLLRSQRSPRDVFGEAQQPRAETQMPGPQKKSPEAAVELGNGLSNAPQEKPKSWLGAPGHVEASKPQASGLALSPPPAEPSPAPVLSLPAPGKQERDRAFSAPPPAPETPKPSPTAAASLGGGVAAAESAPSNHADRVGQAARKKDAGASGQFSDQPEAKEKTEAADWAIRLELPDSSSGRPLIERELARAGATLVPLPLRDSDASRVLRARLDSHRLPELLSRLARIGKVLEQPDSSGAKPSVITISIRW